MAEARLSLLPALSVKLAVTCRRTLAVVGVNVAPVPMIAGWMAPAGVLLERHVYVTAAGTPSTSATVPMEAVMGCPWVGVVSEIAGAPVAGVLLTPVPLRETDFVPTLVTMSSDAERAPTAVGSNVTLNVQLPAGGTVDPTHPDVKPKEVAFPPVMLAEVTPRFEPPVLVNVTVCAAVAPALTARLPKLRGPDTDATAGSARPVPLSETDTVPTLVTMASDAERAPTVVGPNVTLNVQLPAGPRVVPTQPDVKPNDVGLAPVMLAEVTPRFEPPVLVNVTV